MGAFIFLFGCGASEALAQKAGDPLNAGPPPLDMSKVPAEFLEEALAFNDQCAASDTMAQYYDCECLSFAFLKERVAQGSLPTGNAILLSIQGQCRDATLASGSAYDECLNGANLMEPGTDPEEFCACVANSYARLMDGIKPGINSGSMVRYKTQAMVSCRNPALERRLYYRTP